MFWIWFKELQGLIKFISAKNGKANGRKGAAAAAAAAESVGVSKCVWRVRARVCELVVVCLQAIVIPGGTCLVLASIYWWKAVERTKELE